MEVLTTQEIANAVNGMADRDVQIDSIFIDSRSVQKGSLFVAIKGENFDGHNFIKMAVENGAYAVMAHEDIECEVPVIKVDDTSKAFLDLAGYYRSNFDIPIISLTGSVGKTTTKEMIYEVMASKFKTLKTQGNLNNEIGLPKTLFNLDRSIEAAVIEMGMNHAGEIERLSKATKPTIGVLTNVGVSHIENLGSRENILKAKLEMIKGMKTGSTLIINGDNDLLSQVKIYDYKIIKFGIDNESCNVRATDIQQLNCETKFNVLYQDEKYEIVLPTMGVHNVYNALSAIAVGIQFNIDIKDSAMALKNYVPSGMRQRIKKVSSITFVEDCYNSSPDSVEASLRTLKDMAKGRKIAVLGDMLELGSISKKAHEHSGIEANENEIDILLTYGDMSKFTHDIAKEQGVNYCEWFDDKTKLANSLKSIIQPNDTVLFKASRGMALEEVIEDIYKSLEL